jgi:hypothetical protein
MKCDFDTWEVREHDVCLCEEHSKPAPRSWKVEVIADSSGKWCSNGVNFSTEESAKEWGEGLFMRWTAVREWRVSPSDEEPNR